MELAASGVLQRVSVFVFSEVNTQADISLKKPIKIAYKTQINKSWAEY